MSPYNTPLSLYLDKIGAYTEKATHTKEIVFERGNILEPFLKALFERDYGLKVIPKDTRVHKRYDFIKGHIDGIVENDNAIVEFKTSSITSKDEWGEEMTDSIPKHYLLQTHHYLLIHEEFEKAYVPVFYTTPFELQILTNLVKKYGVDLSLLEDINLQLKLYVVKQNEQIKQIMINKYVEFWNNHILPRIPPNWTTCEDLLLLFPSSNEKEIIAEEEEILAVQNIKNKQEMIKILETEIESDKTLLCNKLKDSNKLIDKEGKKIASWSTIISKRFDQMAFKEKYADIANQFYKQISTRTFRVF
jgi:putative phage-type endonuclease